MIEQNERPDSFMTGLLALAFSMSIVGGMSMCLSNPNFRQKLHDHEESNKKRYESIFGKRDYHNSPD